MARYCWLLFVVRLLAPSFCLADGINVSVNGSINATGTVGYVCSAALPCIGSVTASSSIALTGTNTQGDLSTSGQTSATDPTFGFMDSLSMEVDQSVTVTSGFNGDLGDLIQLSLTSFETPGGDLGGGAFSRTSFWSASINNDVSATFTLDRGTPVSLNAAGSPGFSHELLDSAGNPLSNLSGPSPIFLKAGTYQLVDDFTGEIDGFGFNNPTGVQIDTASVFIPAVPEPQWSSAILVLLAALGSFAYRRRTGRTTSS